MYPMQLRSLFLIFCTVVTLSLPSVSSAASASGGINGKGNCPKGITGDPSGSKTFVKGSPANAVRDYLSGVENCASACFNENIVITVDAMAQSMTVRTAATNMCKVNPKDLTAKSEKPPLGCGKGQTQPQITVKTPSLPMGLLKETTVGPKSRCYGAVSTSIDGVIGQLGAGNFTNAQNAIAALQSNYQGPAPAMVLNDAGTDALKSALQGYGLSASDAQTIVNTKTPEQIQPLLDALGSGDQAAAQQAAANAGLTLNGNLSDSTASLAMAAPPTNPDGTPVQSQNTEPNSQSTGFTQNQEPQQVNVASALAGMCDQQGMNGCGNVCPNDSIMVCRTNNPGALTWAQWESKYGGTPCGQNNNTTCFPSMEAGVAAQAELLTTRSRYYGDGNNTILGAICGGGYAASNCSEYASFVSRQTGIPMNQTIDPNNAQQIGAIMMAQSRFESGRGVVYTPDQLQAGLSMAYSGVVPAGTPGYTPQTIYGTGQNGMQYSSPLNVTTGYGVASLYSGSPFAGVTPVSYSNGVQSYTSPLAYTSSGSYGGSSSMGSGTQANGLPIYQQTTDTGNGTTQQATPVPVAINLYAQPATIHLTGSAMVTWSSVGVSQVQPCIITYGPGLMFSQGNAGAKIFAPTASTTGTVTFVLKCFAQTTGSPSEKSASVVVQ